MTHLENYLDILKGMPNELQRGLALIRVLDNKAAAIEERLEQNQLSFFTLCNAPLSEQPAVPASATNTSVLPLPHGAVPLLRAIRADQHAFYHYQQEKVAVVLQLQALLSGHTDKLDHDLEKFEAEIGPQLSGSESKESAQARSERTEKKKSLKREREKEREVETTTAQPYASASFTAPTSRRSITPSHKKQAAQVAQAQAQAANTDLYCFCRQMSFGEMIGCDNDDCRIEWFHFNCVGLKRKPKGKWYCDECKLMM